MKEIIKVLKGVLYLNYKLMEKKLLQVEFLCKKEI